MDLSKVINFLDPMFDTKVKCSCTVDDFHGVENLISNDKQKWNRGFMAYRVVKPPVELEFQLCSCIELMSIKIWPQIDSLKSIGFEIYIKCDSVHSEHRKVGSHFNLQKNGIEFVTDSMITDNTLSTMNFAVIPFYPSTRNILRKVNSIKLIIKQTAKCVPVIKRIEVWGKISKFATQQQQQHVYGAIRREAELIECAKLKEKENEVEESNCTSGDINHTESSIPEAFLDAITFELMALPMVLPSGKIIDSSTLLKHTEHEEKWGRVPSDPFTGRPYTDSRKPVLDVHLKSQIDSFLLKNCDVPELSILPRTVGSAPKRLYRHINDCELRDSKLPRIGPISTNNLLQSNATTATQTIPSSSSSISTQLKVQSLDDAIRGVLKVGKYTASTTAKDNCSHSNSCFQCSDSINSILYTIATCSHLICRNCLVGKNLNICKCGLGFSNIDVNKYHPRELL